MGSAQRPHAGRRVNKRHASLGKRRLGLLALSIMLAVATAGALSLSTFGAAGLASAAVEKARSLVELFNRRSPGQRTQARLVKIKHRSIRPHERALPKVAVNLPFPSFAYQPALIDIVSAPPLMAPAGFDKLPPIAETPPPGSGPPIILPPGEGTPVGPPIVFQPPSPPPPPPPPPPPVPEPATWITMLLGFGLLGFLIRKDPRPASA